MKKIMVFFFAFLLSNGGIAQVGIGTTTPNSSAALDISDTTKGLLIPRMTLIRRLAILNPTKGLLVYQTDNAQGLWYYNGSAWSAFTNGGSSSNNNTGFTQQVKSTTGNITVVYTNSNAYAFCDDSSPTGWYPLALTGTPLGAIALDNMVMVYTTTNAFIFRNATNAWSSHPITGSLKSVVGVHNDMIVLSTTTNLYGAYSTSWYVQPVSEPALGYITGESSNSGSLGYCIIVYTQYTAYAFSYSQLSGTGWYPQALSGTPLGGTSSGNQALVYTSTNAYAFDVVGSMPGNWHPQLLTGTGMGTAPQ